MKQITSQKPCATNRQKPSTDGSAIAIPTNDETTNHVGEDNEPTETEEPKRPMGKKRSKEQLRRGGGKPPDQRMGGKEMAIFGGNRTWSSD
uniref:Uncharacterized protein n=1 Tax=Oryza barthii TaxID=65489 RepID=A0A0D3F4Y0_9ORYZ